MFPETYVLISKEATWQTYIYKVHKNKIKWGKKLRRRNLSLSKLLQERFVTKVQPRHCILCSKVLWESFREI